MKLDYAVNYLYGAMKDTLCRCGERDDKVNKRTEAEICDYFERYVCGQEGDKDSDIFKIAEGDIIYCYDGRKYEKIDDVQMRVLFKKVMERMEVGVVYQKNSAKMIQEQCEQRLQTEERCAYKPDRRYVVFKNCVLDVLTGKVFEPSIKYKTDIILDFEYKEDGKSALWDRVVRETIPDDGMRSAFQQFCGAFLADRNRFKIEYMCLMIGTGRNGKSLVCKAIADMFGDGLVSSYSPEQLFKSSQAMYNLADINGKIANYADDVSNKDISGGDFKQFISGAKFQARHPYGRPFVVTKVPLMLVNCNEIPMSTDDTNGYYRRLLPIVCPNQIADEDVDVELPNKLATEENRCAIFNWLYEGYLKVVANNGKIDMCDTIKEISNDIKEDSNSARRWVRESGFVKVEPEGQFDPRWKSLKEWMALYMEYCRSFSEQPKSAKSVAKLFKDLGFDMRRSRDGMWYCIGQKDEVQVVGEKFEVDNENLPF